MEQPASSCTGLLRLASFLSGHPVPPYSSYCSSASLPLENLTFICILVTKVATSHELDSDSFPISPGCKLSSLATSKTIHQ